MTRAILAAGSAAAIFASAIGPRPVLDRPNEGGAEAVLVEFKALHKDVRGALQEAGAKTTELDARMTDIEQKLARRGGGEPASPQTWGEQVIASPELKSFAENSSRPGRVRFDVKATMTTGSTSGGALSPAQRDGPALMPRRRLVVRNLLNVVQVSTGAVEYPRQTTRTNAAAPVAEAATKPESEYAFDLQTATMKVIAHWVPASRQILEDAPQLRDTIDGELRYGLELKEEQQLLFGSGSGANLLGMVTQATAFAAPFAIGSPTMLDTIGLAILQTSLTNFPPDGIVMHESDWMRIRLLKDADGKYLFGDPQNAIEPRLFGLPVVPTTEMTIDKFLVGSFRIAATLYDRWAPRVEVATEHADFFVKNLVAILAEERIGLAVKQPLALTYGDFGNVA